MPDETQEATPFTTRRTLLAELGAVGMVGLAGCGESGDGDDDGATATPTATETSAPTDDGGQGSLAVTVAEPESVGAMSVTLSGDLAGLGGVDAADVGFEYRQADAEEWTASATTSRSSPGAYTVAVDGLRPDTEYEYRAVATTDGGETATSGSSSVDTAVAARFGGISDVAATSATVAIDVAEGVSDAELEFEYRTLLADAWESAASVPVESGGETVEQTLSDLESRAIYEARATFRAGDYESTTVSVSFTTPNDGDPADDSTYETAAAHHPGDGFADFGWLDDDTVVLRITEPTREQLATALELDRPRLIVFETSGTIDLDGGIAIENDKCWVAGQTAPSPGITMVRGSLFVDAADIVIQHVRVRRGEDTPDAGAGDTVGTSENPQNCVFDHVTATWGTDETLSCYGTDMTISNSIVAEALRNSTFHSGGNGHSAGSLIGSGYERIAMFGNLWASNLTRNPRLQSGTSVVVNNVSYDFRNGVNCSTQTTSSIVGNAYIRGDVDAAAINMYDTHQGEIYLADSYTRPDTQAVVGDGVNLVDQRPVWPTGLEALAADRTEPEVYRSAGARPADRTYHDRRVVRNAANWTATGDELPGGSGLDHAWIDHEAIVGGYPELPANARDLEVPDEGTRAWLGEHARRVETQPDDFDVQYEGGAGVVDDFEDGDLSEWVGALDAYAVTDEAPVASGEYSLKNVTGGEGVVASFTDLPRYPQAGDTVTAKVAPTEETGVVGIAFGIKSFENYYFVRYWPESSALQLFKVSDDEGSDPTREKLAQSGSGSLTTGDVYEFVLDWGADGSIDVELRDDAGDPVMSLSATDTTHRWGGFGTRRSGMLDDVRIR